MHFCLLCRVCVEGGRSIFTGEHSHEYELQMLREGHTINSDGRIILPGTLVSANSQEKFCELKPVL